MSYIKNIDDYKRTRKIWSRMKYDCYSHNSSILKLKGIQVCDEWIYSFDRFVTDMGICPEGYSLRRIDPSKSYYKDNCHYIERVVKCE